MSVQEYTSDRQEAENEEFPIILDGKEYICRPPKKSSIMVNLLTVDRNDDMKAFAYAQAPLRFLDQALDHRHPKTRKQAGHGQESIPGCQACDVYDRLDDLDDPLTVTTLLKAANDLVGKFQAGTIG